MRDRPKIAFVLRQRLDWRPPAGERQSSGPSRAVIAYPMEGALIVPNIDLKGGRAKERRQIRHRAPSVRVGWWGSLWKKPATSREGKDQHDENGVPHANVLRIGRHTR